MIALRGARADTGAGSGTGTECDRPRYLPTHEPGQRQVHGLSQPVTLSGKRGNPLRTSHSERGPALPHAGQRPKIAVCSQGSLDCKIVLVRLGQDRRL